MNQSQCPGSQTPNASGAARGTREYRPVRTGFLRGKWTPPSASGVHGHNLSRPACFVVVPAPPGSPDCNLTYSQILWSFLGSLIRLYTAPFDLNTSFQTKYKLILCMFLKWLAQGFNFFKLIFLRWFCVFFPAPKND